ncbi:hypothetical protein niasHT_026799 [Heterodera trifolii]|uniref:Uncharacterized protein n=2 Tax=Heterodera trifolii TaxID=157864 RepID=A0ABD2JWX4_9BILA
MDFADIDEEDDGSEEFEITSIMLYDRCACMLCGRIRFFYLIDYATPHVVTKWGGSYLKDENVLTHAGFCLGRLLTFVNTFAMDGSRLNAQKARQVVFAKNGRGNEDFSLFGIIDGQRVDVERLFPAVAPPAPAAVPPAAAIAPPAVVLPAPIEVPPANVEIELDIDGEQLTNFPEQQHPQQLFPAQQQHPQQLFPAQQHPQQLSPVQQQPQQLFPAQHQQQLLLPPRPLISQIVDRAVSVLQMHFHNMSPLRPAFPPFFINSPFPRLQGALELPPLQFDQQNQHAFAPALQIAPVDDVPAPQPLCDVVPMAPSCSRRVPRECTRAAYKLLSADQIKAAGQILFGNSRPGSNVSSCSSASASSSSSASSSALSRASSSAKHTERDKKMRMIVEYWKQKCVPNCPRC